MLVVTGSHSPTAPAAPPFVIGSPTTLRKAPQDFDRQTTKIMTKQARKYLIQALDAPLWGNRKAVPICAITRVSARLGPPERPLHCPPRTTSRNKPTRDRVLYR